MDLKLVDTTEHSKDFNTIDLEKVEIANADASMNIKLSTDEEKANDQVANSAPQKVEENINEEIKYDTLKEPITETLKRDVMGILIKVKYVLNPYIKDDDKYKQLRNWDLWGPLLFTIILAVSLAFNIQDKGTLFVLVFVIFWLGGAVVTINAQVLGVKVSIFQILCLLGYCLFPLNLTAVLFKFIIDLHEALKIILVIASCAWSTYSAIGFLKRLIPEEKKLLVIYPIVLFYLFLSFFVLMNHKIEPANTTTNNA